MDSEPQSLAEIAQSNTAVEPTKNSESVYLNQEDPTSDEQNDDRNLRGGHNGHHDHHSHKKDLKDSHDHHKKEGCNGGFGFGHGKKEILSSIIMWLIFVSPLLCLMRKVAWLRQKIAKINK